MVWNFVSPRKNIDSWCLRSNCGKKIFQTGRKEVRGNCKKLYIDEIHNL
jgi:hypothetical protein